MYYNTGVEKKQNITGPFRGGYLRAAADTGGRVMDALSRTDGIEQAVEGLLCPMKMFMQLMEDGWTPAAWRMLTHDLGIKRVLITKQTECYVMGVARSMVGRGDADL
jgi:hypothetical protein